MGVLLPFFILGLFVQKLDYLAVYLLCPVAEIFLYALGLLLAGRENIESYYLALTIAHGKGDKAAAVTVSVLRGYHRQAAQSLCLGGYYLLRPFSY